MTESFMCNRQRRWM